MNENKRLLVLFGVIVLFVAIILVIALWPEKDTTFVCDVKADGDYTKLGALNYEQYECLAGTESANAIVYAKKLSVKEKKALSKAANSIEHAIYYIDVKNMSKSELKKVEKGLKYEGKSLESNVIFVMNNGEVSSYKENILSDKKAIEEYLNEAGLAKFAFGAAGSDEYKNLAEITYSQYEQLYESGNPFAVVLAQTTCGYCLKFKPVIDEYAGDNNIPVYVLEIDQIESEEMADLQKSFKYFEENQEWGTPLTLGIKDKDVVASISGFTEETSELDTFFKDLGLK